MSNRNRWRNDGSVSSTRVSSGQINYDDTFNEFDRNFWIIYFSNILILLKKIYKSWTKSTFTTILDNNKKVIHCIVDNNFSNYILGFRSTNSVLK